MTGEAIDGHEEREPCADDMKAPAGEHGGSVRRRSPSFVESSCVGSRRARLALGLTASVVLASAMAACTRPGPPEDTQAPAAPRPVLPAGATHLARGVHPLARPELDRGPLDPAARIANLSLVYKLTPAQREDRETLKAALVDPRSPLFRKFLTPAEYAARFGAPRAHVERVKGWLDAQGLEVHEGSPLGARVTFSGTVEKLTAAFHTEFRRYEVGGEMHYATSAPPALPDDIAQATLEITHTHDFHPRPIGRGRRPLPAYDGTDAGVDVVGFAPPDWANVYDVTPLYASGIDGTGVTIAIVGDGEIAPSDIAAFRARFNLGAGNLVTTLVPDTGPATPGGITAPGEALEGVLDVEWSGGVAKGATVNYVFTGGIDADTDDAIYYAVERELGSVVSASWTVDENFYLAAGFTEGDQNTFDMFASAANVLGVTLIAGSGDAGAAGQSGALGMYVGLPASHPGVTGVGGTEFPQGTLVDDPQTGYLPGYLGGEEVWNDGLHAASTGGISLLYPRPFYQTPAIAPVCTPQGALPLSGVVAANMRQVPDVAFDAAMLFLECTLDPATQDCSATGGSPTLMVSGGTSFAAPAFAGVVALMNQAVGGRLGNLNPTLYALATTTPRVFHDITTGNNQEPCTPGTDVGCPDAGAYGYGAGQGYDCATGLGSLDVHALVQAVAGETPTTTSLSLSPNPTTEGTPVTLTATVRAPSPNANALGGTVSFAFLSYDQDDAGDLSWSLGAVALAGGSTTMGAATLSVVVPPGLVKAGGESVSLVAAYSGDATHLSSTSATQPLSFGPIAFTIAPSAPTVGPGGTIDFTSSGGAPPVRWYTPALSGTNTGHSVCALDDICPTIVEATGVFTAGQGPGLTEVQAIDANGAEARVTVQVEGAGAFDAGAFDAGQDADASARNASDASDAGGGEGSASAGCTCRAHAGGEAPSAPTAFAVAVLLIGRVRRAKRAAPETTK